MFALIEITLHGKIKYEIVYAEGGRHVAYLNDGNEAKTLLSLLNRKA